MTDTTRTTRSTRAPGRIIELSAASADHLAADHRDRAERLLADHVARRERGRSHPVEDFLFTYYRLRPGELRTWYPGPWRGVRDGAPRRGYRLEGLDGPGGLVGQVLRPDPELIAERAASISSWRRLLTATAGRPGRYDCFGLHEWAMVYRQPPEASDSGGDGLIRHPDWPLRLGAAGTDAVVERSELRCTHVDAYRFFTPDARPRNATAPARSEQTDIEQPGCLHAGMDLYKIAGKLLPWTPGELLLDCFELARDVRAVDMRASPYDFSALGYEVIAVETAAGKAEYVRHQRAFAERGAVLRDRLIDVADALLALPAQAEAAAGVTGTSPCRNNP